MKVGLGECLVSEETRQLHRGTGWHDDLLCRQVGESIEKTILNSGLANCGFVAKGLERKKSSNESQSMAKK